MVFVPAGLAHTYRASVGIRYLVILTPKIDRLIERLLDHDRPDDVRPTLRTFDTELLVHHAVQSRSRPPCGQDRPADTGETIYPRNGRGGRQAEWTILAESCRADFGLR